MPYLTCITPFESVELHLWKISEVMEDLTPNFPLRSQSVDRLKNMKSESHQKGFLAIRKILEHLGLEDSDLTYSSEGKPQLKGYKHVSISHSSEFSTIATSDYPIGIDLEQIKPKILKIAPRFMDCNHLKDLNEIESQLKATFVWGIKESIFKIKNIPGISFPLHISEKPFLHTEAYTEAYLNFNTLSETFEIFQTSIEDYALVCARPTNYEDYL